MKARCAECETDFQAQRASAVYCTATCRQRAARRRKSAAASVAADAAAGKVEHPLVKAIRKELTKLDGLDTYEGQLALQLARKLATPDESGATALSKELRSVMAEARTVAAASKVGDEPAAAPAEPVEDEVERARRQRAESRQAAGLA